MARRRRPRGGRPSRCSMRSACWIAADAYPEQTLRRRTAAHRHRARPRPRSPARAGRRANRQPRREHGEVRAGAAGPVDAAGGQELVDGHSQPRSAAWSDRVYHLRDGKLELDPRGRRDKHEIHPTCGAASRRRRSSSEATAQWGDEPDALQCRMALPLAPSLANGADDRRHHAGRRRHGGDRPRQQRSQPRCST